ncbi:MAG: hypothetical protein HC932_01295 [Thermales bacterium]|nr:hypothetical protein [Thermales bacterium]
MFENGCSLILLACNTATVAAVRYIQNEWIPQNYLGRKVLGIIRPVSEGLIEEGAKDNDEVMILSTQLTHNSNFYQEELAEAGFKYVQSVPMKGLAEAIEKQDVERIDQVLEKDIAVLKNLEKVKYLVLACTHYPLVKDLIFAKLQKYGLDSDVHIFDQGKHVAEKLMDYLKRHDDVVLSDLGGIFFVTGDSDNFEKQLKDIFDLEGYVLEV